MEIKVGRGDAPAVRRTLAESMKDVGATRAWVISQTAGVELMAPGIERRGVTETFEWLPLTRGRVRSSRI